MDIGEFFAMGGYAFYVWSSYSIALFVLLMNVIIPRRREKQLISKLSRRKKLNEASNS
jgi:heme exporter protein D